MEGDKHNKTCIDMASADNNTLCNDLPKLIAQACRHLEAISDAQQRHSFKSSLQTSDPGPSTSFDTCNCCHQGQDQKGSLALNEASLNCVEHKRNSLPNYSGCPDSDNVLAATDDLLLQIMQRALECSSEKDETRSSKKSPAA